MKYVFHFFLFKSAHLRISGSLLSLYLLVGKIDLSHDMRLPASKVLSIIQEKVNNPSPDDPFEPDIAAVILYMSCLDSGADRSPQLLKTDKTKFLATAKEWTKK